MSRVKNEPAPLGTGRPKSKAKSTENVTAAPVKSKAFTLGEVARIRAEGAPLHATGTLMRDPIAKLGSIGAYAAVTLRCDDGDLFRIFAFGGMAATLLDFRGGDVVAVRGHEKPDWSPNGIVSIVAVDALPVEGGLA